MVKAKLNADKEQLQENMNDYYDDPKSYSDSTSTNGSYPDLKNKWYSAEELRKVSYILP
jgi:hypothetical protein